jgi:type VI secretion system protein ImpL
MKRIVRFLTARWLVTLLGALALSLLVWFVGPLIAIADFRPLDGDIARLIAIMAILVAWGLYNVFSLVRQKRTDEKMVATLTEPGKAAGGAVAAESAEEVGLLKKRLEEALQLLKKSSGAKGGTRYVYQLPWYMLIGPPGSGKTTALANSGLNFPLAEKYGRDPVKGVGGTRNCDWWFTDDAVLLDTAGRYTTQDSHADVDQAAWKGFLGLLKKFRPRQPLNGALVAISISDIALLSPAERQQHARAIRQRLHELQQEFGIRFPVYVLFTKADLVAGFVEFFDDLDREAREQVWGMTLPLDDGKETGAPAVAAFAPEFDALVQRLNDRLLERVQREGDLSKRALIFGFPAQVASLREPAKEFLDEIFMPNRFEGRPLLRGIYFTSGTQDGTPIDRMMGAMAATFGLDRQRLAGAFSGTGRSYFIHRLLRGVVFAEASVVSANAAVERRQTWLRRGAYAAALLAFVGCTAAWTASYFGNKKLVAEFDAQMAEYEKAIAPLATPVITDSDVDKTLPPLRIVRNLTPEYGDRGDVPLGLTFGLYQGDKLGAQATQVYRRALANVYMPRLLVRIGNQIRGNLANVEYVHQGLKVYLMLGSRGTLDKDLVRGWMEVDANASFPGPDREPIRKELLAHLNALLERPLPEIALDQTVIDAARRVLQQTSLAARAYTTIKQSAATRQATPWRPIDYAGPAGDRALQRSSGKPLGEGVPGLFTYDGFYKVFLPALATASRDMAKEAWVLGDAAPKGGEATLERDIGQLYAEEYIRTWDGMINDIGVPRFRDMGHGAEVLNVLSSPTSPLKTIYVAISRETKLTKLPDAASLLPAGVPAAAAQAAAGAAAGAAGKVAAALGVGAPPIPPAAQIVEDHFKRFNDFTAGQLDDLIRTLGDVYGQVSQLAQAAPGAPKRIPPDSAVAKLPGAAARVPKPLDGALAAMASNLGALTTGSARAQINEAWQADVLGFCTKAIENRYPMVRTSPNDVTLDDFSRLFKPGGMIDAFFTANLKPFVDTTKMPWKWTTELGIPADVLVQFQRAATIRDLFFPNGAPAPGLKFELLPVSLDPSATQVLVEVDGQEASYAHGPPRPSLVQWPGGGPKQGRVAFQPPTPGQPASINKEGAWSLFRLFDEAKIEQVSGLADRVRVTFTIGGRKATYELRANSVINALTMKELGEFRCPSRL